MDGSFGTLNTKRSFQIHGFFFCHILFFVHCHTKRSFSCLEKDLFIVMYHFFVHCHTKRSFPYLQKIFSIVPKIFLLCHIFIFCSRITGVSGVLILKKILSYFLTFSSLCRYIYSQCCYLKPSEWELVQKASYIRKIAKMMWHQHRVHE